MNVMRSNVAPELALARHALTPLSRLPATARARARDTMLDTFACTLAGLRSAECRALIALYAQRGGSPESTVTGLAQRLPAPLAATANAALAHWFEWDDLHDLAVLHASGVIWPVLAAAAEATGRDVAEAGGEVVAAAVAAFDIAGRVGGVLGPYFDVRWFSTAPACAIGAAAGAARLFGLDEAGIHAAMGLAAVSGLSRAPLNERVTGKNALGAQTVAAAWTAVDLARVGVVGASHFLTGPNGLLALFSGGRGDVSDGFGDLGERFTVEEMSVKPYPCCRAAHSSIDLALDLRQEIPALAAEVTRIELSVNQAFYDVVGAAFTPGRNPRVSAQFSIPYTVAVALLNGQVRLGDFNAETVLAAAAARELAAKVTVSAFPLEPGQTMYEVPIHMRVHTRDGGVLERSTLVVKGSPARPMTAADTALKIADCAEGRLDAARQERLIAAAAALESGGIGAVLSLLREAVPPS